MLSRNDACIKAYKTAVLALERKRKSRIFSFIQDDDAHICHPELRALMDARDRLTPVDTLEVIVHSNGGHIDIAYQMACFFRSRCKRLHMIVPRKAKSAATLLCLVADKIYMGEFSELGPLDVQLSDPVEKGAEPFSPLDEFKSLEYLEEYATEVLDIFTPMIVARSGMSIRQALHEAIPAVAQMMAPLYAKVEPSKVGGYRRQLAVGEEYAKRLLAKAGRSDADALAQKLVWSYPSHDFVIKLDEAKSIGLPVEALDIGQERVLLEHLREIQEIGASICALFDAATKKDRNRKRPVSVPTADQPDERVKATAAS